MKPTILLAETHKEQTNFIKQTLEKISDQITILDDYPQNSEELLNCIVELKPTIVFTNEQKDDYPATDLIKKIQSDNAIYQPNFIISSGYNDIENMCFSKNIHIFAFLKKPYDFDLINTTILDILSKIK